jgi:hypothetical protein
MKSLEDIVTEKFLQKARISMCDCVYQKEEMIEL